MDSVDRFLREYGRTEADLLDGDALRGPGYAGEREFIEFAERDYERDRHHAFEIRAEECALIVVDLQEDFVNPGNPMCVPEAYRQIPRVRALIDGCRAAGVPVIYTENTVAPDVAHDFYEFWPALKAGAVAEGSPGAKLYHGLKPEPGERVVSTKHSYDSFTATDLDYALRVQGVRTIIVCGTLTNYCCESTARSGYFLGYHVVFGSDVNATDTADAHAATLRTLRRGFARVMDHQAILRALTEGDPVHHEAVAARREA